MKLLAAFTCLFSLGFFCNCSTRNDLADFGDFRMTGFDSQAGARSGMETSSTSTEPVIISTPVPHEITSAHQEVYREQVKSSIPSDFAVRTTAYTHTEPDSLPYGTKTAQGGELQFGHIRSAAADWSRYPVGTRFQIKGLPYEYVVDDYGSALVGTDTIDLYKPNYSTMNQWGARNVDIKVLEWGSFDESRKILKTREHKAGHVKKMLKEIDKKIEAIPLELRDGFSA